MSVPLPLTRYFHMALVAMSTTSGPGPPGAVPVPVTMLVELPPLLVNTTLVVTVPAPPGMKLTITTPVCPLGMLYGVPLVTVNRPALVDVPLNVCPPVLMTVNGCVLVWPTATTPKSMLAGVTASTGGGGLIVNA